VVCPEGPNRRLAAILSADVVGYSRLMAEDVAATVRTLTAYRKEIHGLVNDHRGRVVDATGDNLLAEFPTALDAVECAVEIQRVIGARNAGLPEDRRMEFRIGVHLGDVTVEDDRLYGDGVNIAARLEGLAEPAGVCISSEVLSQIRRKLEIDFDDLGEQTVKNIPDPVHAYRVRARAEEARAEPSWSGRRMALVAAVAIVLAVGAWQLWERNAGVISPGAVPEAPPGFANAPAIAVLPFDNLSGDPDQEYFADGLAEDLITRLSRLAFFPVIARNSSFSYRGQAIDVKQIGRELGVGYVVEGSVRTVGERVRIHAQLIDAATGRHVWAEQYDRELSDVLALQDEVTLAIASALGFEVREAEMARTLGEEVRDLGAWHAFLRGWWHMRRGQWAEAISFYERARELDPGLAGASWGLVVSTVMFRLPAAQSDAERERLVSGALREAERCLDLNSLDPLCHLAMGLAQNSAGEHDRAIASWQRACELDPSLEMAHRYLGWALALGGRPAEALASLEKAARLSPRDPLTNHLTLLAMSWAHFAAGRYPEAIEAAERGRSLLPRSPMPYRTLAASYGQLGRLDEARAALEEERRREPDLSLAKVRRENETLGTDPEFLERWLDGLRKAGLEE
jgi:adenylate cyclase